MVEGCCVLSWSISCWLMYLVGKIGYFQRNWLLDNYDDGDLYREKSTLSHHHMFRIESENVWLKGVVHCLGVFLVG